MFKSFEHDVFAVLNKLCANMSVNLAVIRANTDKIQWHNYLEFSRLVTRDYCKTFYGAIIR